MSLLKKGSNPFSFENNIKDPGINRRSRVTWTEETYIDSPRKKNDEKQEFIGPLLSRKKLNGLLLLLCLGILALGAQTAYLQIFKGEHYYRIAEGNRIRIRPQRASRGIIYDRNKNPVVKNVPSFSLSLVPADLPKNYEKRNESINYLAKIIKESPETIFEEIQSIKPGSLRSYQPITIKENIDYQEAIILKVKSADLPGVILEIGTRRQYLGYSEESSLSHVLGYLGKITEKEWQKYQAEGYLMADYIGKTGLELFYEDSLRGKYGREQIEVDALGKKKKVIAKEKSIAGNDIILSLDLDLQKKLEETLKKQLKNLKKTRGAAVAIDPQNGEILALVSLPTFDNNIFLAGVTTEEFQELVEDPNKPLFPRSISGEYPSGSTIKPIIAAAALEEGVINSSTGFQSVGGIQIDKWFFPDWKSGGHGWTNVTKAIAESVNTFFYTIGGGYGNTQGLGVAKITEYARLFGLADRLGIDLPGEALGFLPSKEWKKIEKGERWYVGDTYHLAIGQGDILVTPLQVAAFTSVFANGGVLYQPHLVKEILDPTSSPEGSGPKQEQDKKVKKIESKIIRKNFIEQAHINTIRQGLRQAVTSGSARRLLSLPIPAAGKTGTAQWSSKNNPHAWFTGWAPYNNPEIVVTILIEEGGEGSATAVPVAEEVLKYYFQTLKKD